MTASEEPTADSAPPEYLFVCTGPRCSERGGERILAAWKEILQGKGILNRCRVIPVDCFGECATGPNVCGLSAGRLVAGVDPARPEAALVDLLSETGFATD